jgi:hypothetical protein
VHGLLAALALLLGLVVAAILSIVVLRTGSRSEAGSPPNPRKTRHDEQACFVKCWRIWTRATQLGRPDEESPAGQQRAEVEVETRVLHARA